MTPKQLQWVGVPRSRLPRIQMTSVTHGGAAASKEVFLPYLDDQLTRERQKTWISRKKLAEGALVKRGLESKKHVSGLTSRDRNPETETPTPKKRLLSRLLSFGTSPLARGLGQPVLPHSERHTPLQDRQNESKKSLGYGREHGNRVMEESCTPSIGRKRDRQQEKRRLFLPTVTHIPEVQPPPIVSDYTSCGLANVDFSNTLDGDVLDLRGTPHNPMYTPSRDPKGCPIMPQQTSIATDLFIKMPPILAAGSFVSTPQKINSAGKRRVSLLPSNEAQARTRNVSPLSINASPKNPSGAVRSPLLVSAHPTTCLDEAICQNALHYPGSHEVTPQVNGLTESKRRSTYNWIQGLPEHGGSVFDTRNPGSSTGQSLVLRNTPEPLNTSLPRAEDWTAKADSETTVTQPEPMQGCLPLASGRPSRDSVGLISSQIKGGFGSVIGRPWILAPGEISSGGPTTPSGPATIRRIPSDPFSRVMLSAPGIPIAARYPMSKRVVWARAMAAREVRERDQLLSRRAKMGWG
ncbi:MAG: hypothetical protein M1840_001015 [Geoglossum simile]|nr:MAG: hypothetical protein M1840_001015 [Geoglossum simile]